jgi:anti-anti-sigma factor
VIAENLSESKVEAVGPSPVVVAGDYLNKLTGESIERECKLRLDEGCKEIIVDFSQTDIINSIGISILLGVIDNAENLGARVVFSELKPETIDLFEMLGITKHVTIA